MDKHEALERYYRRHPELRPSPTLAPSATQTEREARCHWQTVLVQQVIVNVEGLSVKEQVELVMEIFS